MDGILNISKPAGITSFGVVSLVRRLSGERRVGHAGTLDPLATGVLPVCLGQGTRVIEFLVNTTKTYRAEIELGTATDTYDAAGRVTRQGNPGEVTWDKLETALSSFRGKIQQTPPLYSALKYRGTPLYKLARAGITVERESRPVNIHRLELIDFQIPFVTLEIICSKGTYIRSLANDLGELLGCAAHLKNLIRLRCGMFDIKDSLSMPQVEDAFRYGYWQQFVYSIDCVLIGLSAVVISDTAENDMRNGRMLTLSEDALVNNGVTGMPDKTEDSFGNICRAYSVEGNFLGMLRYISESGKWSPEKVFFN